MKENTQIGRTNEDVYAHTSINTGTLERAQQETLTPRINEDQASKTSKYGWAFASLETGFIVIGMLFILLIMPRTLHGDATYRYQYISQFLHQGIVQSVQNKYSLIGPIFSLPLLYIGEKLGKPVDWILLYNYIVFAISLLATYLLCKDRLDRGLLRKFFLLMITASMFAAHLASYYGEVFTAVCVGFGIMAALIRFTSLGGWIVIVLGVANTPATLVAFGLVVLKRILDKKRLRYALAIIAAAILVLGESWIRRGSPFASGYDNDAGYHTFMPYSGLPGFSYPFFFGLLSIFFSFGKGLIFFTPGLFLPIGKTLKMWRDKYALNMYQVYTLWICFVIGLVIIYSRWWSWYGGRYWGPRFFLFASIPASFALAVRLHNKETHLAINIFTAVVLALSSWVGICAVLFQSYVYLPTCAQNNYALEAACHYIPEYSVLWSPFVTHPHLQLRQELFLAYSLIVFIYFMFPLLFKIYQQARPLIVSFVKANINIREWSI
ncbi:hypothetical protein [Dictyobacter kobayashii]|uniref:Glycosyltransferase RgtA/B/C/D-like domain-containing protein n=1 Tax=Dictyobacter kobayashii TaxID=2014872 RepID=A0A402AUF1_9CHLR|nr:hypothetical protein [Dictyobacter kobayashii]GCE22741.1 hypothetical protein KDK_65410 [Dictyobacter kobayashii]